MTNTIITTEYGRNTQMEYSAKEALKWLIKNRSRIEMDRKDIESLKSQKVLTDTPVSDVYSKIVNNDLFDQYFIMDLSRVSDIPVLLTDDELSIDGIAFESAPEDMQNIWVNLAPVLGQKRSSKSGSPIIADMPRYMGYFVRGMICMSYNDNENWLNPSLKPFVIESYSLASRLRVAQAYNLDADDAALVQTAFAFHYAQQISPHTEFQEYPPILNRCGFLGSQNEIQDRLRYLNDSVDEHFYDRGLTSLCEAIASAGPPRMEGKFNQGVYLRLFSIGNIDNRSLTISTGFPPYWVYLLMKYASGGKNALMGNLFRMQYMKKGLKNWVEGVVKYRGLITERR